MKNEAKAILIVLIATITLAAAIITGSTITQDEQDLPIYWAHEWGVFEQVYGSTVTNIGTIPSVQPFIVKKPVVYFHSDQDLEDIHVEVTIDGDILVTIPEAFETEDGIGWVVDVVNNTVISPDGAKYDYLFYECQMNITQGIVAFVTDDGQNVTFYVKNIGDFCMTDLFYIYGYSTDDHFWSRGVTYIHIDELDSGEAKTITVERKNNSDYSTDEILEALMGNGLTQDESQDLIDYWKTIWFNPTNMGSFAQLFYTIPEEVYDELLPIQITPAPEYIKRVGLFFVTDIPVNQPELEELSVECSSLWGEEYINTTWLDEDTLMIEAGIIMNCCQSIANATAYVSGDELLLSYEILGENICHCMCLNKVKFVISGLPQKDFEITLEALDFQ